MFLEYTSVRLLLQSAVSISRVYIYGKNRDGCDNNVVSIIHTSKLAGGCF